MSRLFSALGTLFLIVIFGVGLFLLVVADEMPAPGLILMGVGGVMLIRRFFGRAQAHRIVGQPPESAFTGSQQALDSYDYDMERRRRGECDSDPHSTNH